MPFDLDAVMFNVALLLLGALFCTVASRLVMLAVDKATLDESKPMPPLVTFLERFSAVLALRRRVSNLETLCIQLMVQYSTVQSNQANLHQNILNVAAAAGLQVTKVSDSEVN